MITTHTRIEYILSGWAGILSVGSSMTSVRPPSGIVHTYIAPPSVAKTGK